MKKDATYEVIKDIPYDGGAHSFKVHSIIRRTHGVYSLDGGILPQGFQDDLDRLISHEEATEWKYLVPIRTTKAFKNSKEDF